jgi:hypothetical protein
MSKQKPFAALVNIGAIMEDEAITGNVSSEVGSLKEFTKNLYERISREFL